MTDNDTALALRLADAAGAAIRPYFRARFEIETKADDSPVTAADRASEAAMRAIVEAERPTDGIIGEEYGRIREGAARQWVFDPIDGTRAFIAGRPLFGTLIALLEDGVPVLGVIDQTIIGDRWLGVVGQPTLFNGVSCQVRACAGVARAHLATTSPFLFRAGGDLDRFEQLRPLVRDSLYGGDCHNYGLLASGHLDLVIEAGLQLYDFAALVPVVEGAGGAMTDWEGRPLGQASGGRVIAAGDRRVLNEALAALG